jgi:hypothetical protein
MTQLPADFPPMPAEDASLAAVITWLIELIRWWVARAASRDEGEGTGEAGPGVAPTPPPDGPGCFSPEPGEPDSPTPMQDAGSRRGTGARRAVASLAPLGNSEAAEAGEGAARGAGQGAGQGAGRQTAPLPPRRSHPG